MLKWIGIALAASVALVLAAALALWLTFDPNDYKDFATQWVEQQTGRQLEVEGDLKLSFFPWLGVATGRLVLENAAGFDETAFASVENAAVQVKLLPLLRRRFEVDTVVLDGLIMNLARDRAGRGNWEDLREDRRAVRSGAPAATDRAPLNSIQVAGLRLQQATIYWRENVSEVRYVIRDLSVNTGALRAGQPVDVTIGLNLLGVEPQYNLDLQIAGTASIDPQLDAFTAPDLSVEFDLKDASDGSRARGEAAASVAGSLRRRQVSLSDAALDAILIDPPGAGVGKVKLNALCSRADMDLDRQTLVMEGGRSDLGGIAATWRLQAEQLLQQPRLTGALAAPAAAWERALELAGVRLPQGVARAELGTFHLAADFSYTAAGPLELRNARLTTLGLTASGNLTGGAGAPLTGHVTVPRFASDRVSRAFAGLLPENLSAAELGPLAIDTRFSYAPARDELLLQDLNLMALGLEATGTVKARPLTNSAAWTGQLTTRRFSPRDLMTRFSQPVPDTADDQALTRATVSSDLTVTSHGGQFSGLRLTLDDSVITGRFNVTDYADPTYDFNLTIDAIDVDRYLPPPAADAAGDAKPITRDQVKVPTETLDGLQLSGAVAVGRLQLAGLRFADVSTAVQTGNGSARLSSAQAKLYGGQFDGNLSVDTRGGVPAMTLQGTATGLQIEPLLLALRGAANITGTGSFDLTLSGRGATVAQNMAAAAGNIQFALRDGAVKGFNLGQVLCRVYNAQKKLPGPTADVPNVTRFNLLRGSATVREGIATSRDIEAASSFLAVSGTGSLDLAAQGLSYDLVAKLTNGIQIPGCQSMDAVVGESIPFTVRGTISDPRIVPDFGRILEQAIRRRVEQELKEKLLDRLGLPRPAEGGQ